MKLRTGVLFASIISFGLPVIVLTDPGAGEAPKPVDFVRDVRPILSERCFSCHGPDASKRKADLRLDTRDGLFEELDEGFPVVAGKSAESTILARIAHSDDRERMPPAKGGPRLAPAEVDTIRRWIEEGAVWKDHWAFVPPARQEPPSVKDAAWPRTPIDRFILARLEREGLSPNAEADEATLLRRVSQDLTGLPPTSAELDAFAADEAPDAYEKAVDRLLASPRFGERMALEWLDLARYADTHGYHIDSRRDMWRWRDWVIDAFRENKPFDQFALEQLAGDLLPQPTLANRVATGFNRNNMVNFEGGAIPEEYHAQYVADRVSTTSTAFLGLTLNCAQCHDHKYDPLTQKDYYRFFAFFNKVPEAGLDGARGNAAPFIKAPTRSEEEALAALALRIREKEEEARAMEPALGAAELAWEASLPRGSSVTAAAGLIGHWELDRHLADTSGSHLHARPATVAEYAPGRVGESLKLDGRGTIEIPGAPDFDRTQAFSYGAWVHPSGREHMAVLSKMVEDSAFRGFDLYLGGGKVFVHLIHAWEKDAVRVNTKGDLAFEGLRHVFVSFDGSGKAAGVKVYVDGKPRELETTHDSLEGTIRNEAPLRIGGRGRGAPFRGEIDDVRIYERALTPREVEDLAEWEPLRPILSLPRAQRSAEEAARLRAWFLARHAPEGYASIQAEMARLHGELLKLEDTVSTAMVMQEMDTPRKTHVLLRGAYDAPGEEVEASTPACLPPLPPGEPRNRLGLARWIIDPANPLTARVAVNRFWQQFFGTGIVKTVEDFGSQGELPSHPELLDWLATEFVGRNWDVNAMVRLIVTSATYRQSSRLAPGLHERDPENRLLARGPRQRLKAELVRDGALLLSGLLVETIGGPSVNPYQPGDLWKDVAYGADFSAQSFEQDHGDKLYRKSLYTFWKRSSPPASLSTFDAPDREICRARRAVTNTPLQALVLLNDVQYVEAARAFAERILREGGPSDEDKISRAFREATSRPPEAEETGILLALLSRARETYGANARSAIDLLSAGESKRDETLAPAEHAAWTVLTSAILNLDETITKH